MVRRSWLDGMIESFQHRWETNPQYRATMSGILGVIFLVFMCSCVGIVSAGANVALTGLGFGGGGNGNSVIDTNTGSKAVHSAGQIPIATVTFGTPQAIPQTTLASSGTPFPTATPSPTPTETATPGPCTSNCGGGGGGGCPSCNLTASFGGIWGPNQNVSITVTATKGGQPQAGVGVNLIINPSGCGTILSASDRPSLATDGSGNTTPPYSFTLCSTASGSVSVSASANFSGVVKYYSFSH